MAKKKQHIEITYKTADGEQIRLTGRVMETVVDSIRDIRSQRRQDRRHLAEYADGFAGKPMNPPEDISDLVIRMDSYRELYAAIKQLSEKQRRRLTLHYFEGYSYRRIAEMEGVSAAAVASTIAKATQTLRVILE